MNPQPHNHRSPRGLPALALRPRSPAISPDLQVREDAEGGFVLEMLGEVFISNDLGSVRRTAFENKTIGLYFEGPRRNAALFGAITKLYAKHKADLEVIWVSAADGSSTDDGDDSPPPSAIVVVPADARESAGESAPVRCVASEEVGEPGDVGTPPLEPAEEPAEGTRRAASAASICANFCSASSRAEYPFDRVASTSRSSTVAAVAIAALAAATASLAVACTKVIASVEWIDAIGRP